MSKHHSHKYRKDIFDDDDIITSEEYSEGDDWTSDDIEIVNQVKKKKSSRRRKRTHKEFQHEDEECRIDDHAECDLLKHPLSDEERDAFCGGRVKFYLQEGRVPDRWPCMYVPIGGAKWRSNRLCIEEVDFALSRFGPGTTHTDYALFVRWSDIARPLSLEWNQLNSPYIPWCYEDCHFEIAKFKRSYKKPDSGSGPQAKRRKKRDVDIKREGRRESNLEMVIGSKVLAAKRVDLDLWSYDRIAKLMINEQRKREEGTVEKTAMRHPTRTQMHRKVASITTDTTNNSVSSDPINDSHLESTTTTSAPSKTCTNKPEVLLYEYHHRRGRDAHNKESSISEEPTVIPLDKAIEAQSVQYDQMLKQDEMIKIKSAELRAVEKSLVVKQQALDVAEMLDTGDNSSKEPLKPKEKSKKDKGEAKRQDKVTDNHG